MTHATELIDELREPTTSLRSAAPLPWGAFGELHKTAMAGGALSPAVKELMALAIAVVTHCDGCVAYHARGAARQGATAEQAAEALAVALLMGGGPASVTAPRAWEAFNEFAAKSQRRTTP